MKKKLLFLSLFLTLAFCFLAVPKTIQAAGGEIAINSDNFPDVRFRYYISRHIDTDGNGELSGTEVSAVQVIDCRNFQISNLKGIEYFTMLTYLHCQDNKLTSLDLSGNTSLTYLNCSNNQLSDLNISKSTKLQYLQCSSNRLTSLSLSNNKELISLECKSNQLNYLSVSNFTKLETLDVSDNSELDSLYCSNCSLITLDVSGCTSLNYLSCSENMLSSLDVSQSTELYELDCYNNHLTSLNVSRNTELTSLYCFGNKLTSLSLSAAAKLEELACAENSLTSLDVRKNTKLTSLDCSDNRLSSLNVTNNKALEYLYCYNNEIRVLDISFCPGVVFAYVNGPYNMSPDRDYSEYYDTAEDGTGYTLQVDTFTRVKYMSDPDLFRLYGTNRYKTSIKIADMLKSVHSRKKFKNVILVSGQAFPDGLSASYLASVLSAPILTTDGKESRYKEINEYVLKNLAPEGTVYIIGGKSVIPDEAVKDLSSFFCVRLAGETRYETNLKVLEYAGICPGSDLLIATGTSFPDSLSVSSTGLPLLLLSGKKSSLTDQQKAILASASKAGCAFTIIGGTSAISEGMQKAISQCTGKTPGRVAGDTRYKTSAAIAAKYFEHADRIILGYGENFPDALCAGPLGAAFQAPVILSRTGKASAINAAKNFPAAYGIHMGCVLGGPTLISDADVRTILELDANTKIPVK